MNPECCLTSQKTGSVVLPLLSGWEKSQEYSLHSEINTNK